MNETIVASIITGLVSVILSYLTAHFTSKHEVDKWKRADDVASRDARSKVISEVSKWLTQPYNLHQRQVSIEAVSAALTFADGQQSEILRSLSCELSKESPDEKTVRSLIRRFQQ